MNAVVDGVGLIHRAFEAQARRTPDRVAVVRGTRELTYAEVDRRANQLARVLRRHGAGRETLVGVCLPRDEWLVPSLLAVLKSGAAYVPLDPAYPHERLALIAADADLRLALLGPDQAAPWLTGTTVTPGVDGLDEDGGELVPVNEPHDAAYVIYTSGSTGRPKGVVIEHRNTVNMIGWVAGAYDADELGGMMAGASICFDFSVAEIFPPLTVGGTVILLENALGLLDDPARGRIRFATGVPSALTAVLDTALPPSVRTVITGGERVTRALVDRILANPGVTRVTAAYGPTECTTYSTAYDVHRDDAVEPIPLGGPVCGAVLSVRDEAGRPLADGEQGELWIGGPLVGRGYLHRSDLTEAAFREVPGGRMYRTGDLVSVSHGRLLFHGRTDDQVKVRGFRVELGEVEAALLTHPGVRNAVVLPVADGTGVGALAAYAESAASVTPAELASYLRARLPAHMVPDRVTVLDRIPISSTGKADRQALAALEAAAEPVEVVAPRDDTERRVWDIATAVLGRTGFGVLEPLTRIGAHSLTAARVSARLAAEFGSAPSPAEVLAASIADLAAALAGAVPTAPRPAPTRHPGRTSYPLTTAQREFMMIRELGGPGATTIGQHLRCHGVSDAALLRAALDALVARHEALRTRLVGTDAPVEVLPPSPVPLRIVEAAGLSQAARQAVAEPFDLAAGVPLVRAVAAPADLEDAWDLVFLTDHTVFDGWSTGVLMRELAADLAAQRRGAPPAPPGDRLQLGDLALHDQWAPANDEHSRYWREVLAGVAAPHDLPGTAEAADGLGRHQVPIPADLVRRITRLAATAQVTPFAVYLAALAVVVNGLTGRADTLLSSPYARRDEPAREDVIGPLLAMMPIRLDVTPQSSFSALAAQAVAATTAGLGHTDLPFEDIVAAVSRPAGAPALPVALSLQPPELAVGVRADEVTVELVDELRGGGHPDVLSFFVNESIGGTRLAVEYPRGRFGAADAAALADRLLRVLATAVAEPHRPVGSIELLSAEELDRVRSWGEASATEQPRTLVAAVLDQARRAPDRIAVTAVDGDLTYAELAAESARVAGTLLAAGMRPGEIVAGCLPRQRLVPALLLGISRAGGTFLPLDPDHPTERLSYQVGDCDVRFVLAAGTGLATARQLTAHHAGLRLIDAAALPGGPAPADAPDLDDICYVLYTSGSTGRPKGVEVSHRSLGVNLAAMRQVMHVTADDTVLSVSPISFDVGHLGIWLPLTTGGRCVLVDNATATDGNLLARRLHDTGVTVCFVPPSGLRLLVTVGWTGKSDLRAMSIGEAIDPALARALYGLVGQLWNGYGPTEAAIAATVHQATGHERLSVPIGRPLPGYRVYVVDHAGRPVPPGVLGELWIAGPAVSRRYRNRPEETRAAFGTDPFRPDQLRYRTGDLVRWLPDGRIDFVGRRDHQVKVRGHRIELGEIEWVLREHPLVADACVATAQLAGETNLVAYVVWRGAADVASVQATLGERLPSYMVPQRWVQLSALPLNASGKIDRRALPDPAESDRPRVAPATAMAEFAAGIWAEVLQLAEVYAGDDFFALGGHSFAANRVTGRIRDILDCEVPVRLLFDHPVLSAYAAQLEILALESMEETV
ncbi:non-ribosomal peptide synthetase [Catellatospora tritici]|uniref:non-ribosomal peptide synthetase n=1 Tax=Catellatospora tritici TaxID=2851566 RepID=UPI001C2CDBED|nr:non-ribosomal peptide synthetase [Catellatospora tritici]MBV1850665.1 amino acid adenylation domain-containing protein [Catellatospora tritici]